jgi:hypothetical protein
MATATIPNRPAGTDARSIAQILANFDVITTQLNGNVDGDNLSSATRIALGVDSAGVERRGKSIIATTGTRTNAAYGALSDGPDQVSSIVVPADGQLWIQYEALWSESVSGVGRAAIFIGGVQLQIHYDNSP